MIYMSLYLRSFFTPSLITIGDRWQACAPSVPFTFLGTYHTLMKLLFFLLIREGRNCFYFVYCYIPMFDQYYFLNEWIMGKTMKANTLCVNQDKLGYIVVTENRKAQWLNITKVYCLPMLHVQCQFSGVLCTSLSLRNSAIGGIKWRHVSTITADTKNLQTLHWLLKWHTSHNSLTKQAT